MALNVSRWTFLTDVNSLSLPCEAECVKLHVGTELMTIDFEIKIESQVIGCIRLNFQTKPVLMTVEWVSATGSSV